LNRSGWLGRALDHRVLLDREEPAVPPQRPGRRCPGAATPQHRRATRHFRADAIVQDAELLRHHLLGEQGR
jgi:hypothetical protein